MPPTDPDEDRAERDEPAAAQPTDTGVDERSDAEREAAEFGGD